MRGRLLLPLAAIVLAAGCVEPLAGAADDPVSAAATEPRVGANRAFQAVGSALFLVNITGSDFSVSLSTHSPLRETSAEHHAMIYGHDLTANVWSDVVAGYGENVGGHIIRGNGAHHVNVSEREEGWFAQLSWLNPEESYWNHTVMFLLTSGGPGVGHPFSFWINGTDARLVAEPTYGDAWTVPRSSWDETRVVAYAASNVGAAARIDAHVEWETRNGTMVRYASDPFGVSVVRSQAYTLSDGNQTWTMDHTDVAGLLLVSPENDIGADWRLTSRPGAWTLDVERHVADDDQLGRIFVADIALPAEVLAYGTVIW